ncbi:hypothetical protein EJ06DRAFT_278348 [Trichodelitschia bisporula]|uniref:Glycoside hydrolase family 125 protein n=1 Tax=Trichodelitschia bisporula TaxID=703511 RepID=A0A6G1I594_9PEZI|nr:hypothetical protein EJ06DRAFT_278348 [Trichodelitschia bisporula]
MAPTWICTFALASAAAVAAQCPDYAQYATANHSPVSSGRYQLAFQRPTESCRTFTSPTVEQTITRLRNTISDPDLARLFENAFPNTLDTAIRWRGTAKGSDEELTFVITGDINAMWLRDSANQMQSYMGLVNGSDDPLAGLVRGVINLQARYIAASPFCNSFQPPVEAGLPLAGNGGANGDTVFPPYDPTVVFECKYELDSLAAFLQISAEYYSATGDAAFFGKYGWKRAVRAVLDTAYAMTNGTYAPDGKVLPSPYTWMRSTTRATETLANDGVGNPVAAGTGLVRSAFRPSDDAAIYQLFIPANMMFARYLAAAADIADKIREGGLSSEMKSFAASVRAAVLKAGVVEDKRFGKIYAYEVDGFGGVNIMDDANIPSLLAAPMMGFVERSDVVYQNTRKMILGAGNPYFMRGPVINAVGGPHNGPGLAWPMASIVRILTSDEEDEVRAVLKEIVASTDGLGLIHESVDSFNAGHWTRQWFSWANGLFGQMILDLEKRMPGILKQSFQ